MCSKFVTLALMVSCVSTGGWARLGDDPSVSSGYNCVHDHYLRDNRAENVAGIQQYADGGRRCELFLHRPGCFPTLSDVTTAHPRIVLETPSRPATNTILFQHSFRERHSQIDKHNLCLG